MMGWRGFGTMIPRIGRQQAGLQAQAQPTQAAAPATATQEAAPSQAAGSAPALQNRPSPWGNMMRMGLGSMIRR